MLHLRSIARAASGRAQQTGAFPFTVPAIAALERIDFAAAVTFFVGENGSGKSTLLAGIACAAGSVSAGAEGVKADPTLAPARLLADSLRLSWTRRTRRGLFLRAEDFFGYVKRLAQTRAELQRDLDGVDEAYSTAGRSARSPTRNWSTCD
jgi:predicted ATPase